MAPKITDAMLIHFEHIFCDFLNNFKSLNLEQSIRPKIHFFTFLLLFERTAYYWAMNDERLNGAIKRPAHTMNNFRDPIETLAFKRQTAMLRGS